MKVKAYDLGQHAKHLQKLEDAVGVARQNLDNVRKLNGQTGYDITISGVRISVADMDSRTYNAKLIRGRDMLHLGSLKVLQSLVDDAEAALSSYRAKVRAEVIA